MALPKNNTILNSKERKKILEVLNKQFGIIKLPQGVYLMNSKEKILYVNRDIERIDLESFRIDSLGMYIGSWQRDGFRLSIEGAQLFAPQATKNVFELPSKLKNRWLKGEDLEFDDESFDYLIVKSGDDILGSGKRRGHDLLNYVPKARRLIVINE